MRRRRPALLLSILAAIAAGLVVAARPGGAGEAAAPPARGAAAAAGGGPVRVVDGDTLHIGRDRIRLYGIDAPERAQSCARRGRSYPCGREAMLALRRLVGASRPRCAERDRDSYGRSVAVCTVAGRDLGQAMVASGWAVAYRRYASDYVGDEARARAARAGLWEGRFERPDLWRAERRH